MKQLVLFVTILMLIKPLWPLAEYVVNYDYIVENLCENRTRPSLNCDGMCYLSKQLAKESESNDKNPFDGKRLLLEIQFFASVDRIIVKPEMGFGIITVQHNFMEGRTFISRLFTSEIAEPPELG